MTSIKVKALSVPRTPRNGRIYASSSTTTVSIGAENTTYANSRNVQAKILSYNNGDFDSRTIEVEFGTEFFNIPVGGVKCYRYEPREGGGVSYANAVWYGEDEDWLTSIGFKIIIEDYESLEGLFVEYCFTSQDSEDEEEE